MRVFFFIPLLICTYLVRGQYAITLPKGWPKQYKEGATYLVVKNKRNPELTAYINAVKEAWTYNKLEVIDSADIALYYTPNNLFLNIETERVSSYANAQQHTTNFTFVRPVLRLWTLEEKFFTKNKTEVKEGAKIRVLGKTIDDGLRGTTLAKYYIHVEFNPYFDMAYTSSKTFPSSDLNGNPYFLLWGPGVLKSIVLTFSRSVEKGEKKDFYDRKYFDETRIKELQQKKLFVPDNVLWKKKGIMGYFFEKAHDADELMKKYPFPYEVLSTEQLNKMLSGNDDFYYLHYVQSMDEVFISVIDARTGHIIYSTYKKGYDLDRGDLSDIASKVK